MCLIEKYCLFRFQYLQKVETHPGFRLTDETDRSWCMATGMCMDCNYFI